MNPLIPVFLTGALALIGLIITKETKVSEFRQAWIDALRAEIADLLASIHMSLAIRATEDGTGIKDRDALSPDDRSALLTSLRQANVALFTIRLRLNPTEQRSMAILKTLDEMEILSNDDSALAEAIYSGTSDELEKKIISQSLSVLSEEWKRVRFGEPFFKWTRIIAAFIAISIAIIIAVQAFIPVAISLKPVIFLR